MAERHTVDVDVVGSKPIRLPLFLPRITPIDTDHLKIIRENS